MRAIVWLRETILLTSLIDPFSSALTNVGADNPQHVPNRDPHENLPARTDKSASDAVMITVLKRSVSVFGIRRVPVPEGYTLSASRRMPDKCSTEKK